jgi:hypothetical protein
MNRWGSSLWRVGQRRRRLNACNEDRHRRDRGGRPQYPNDSDPASEFIALHASPRLRIEWPTPRIYFPRLDHYRWDKVYQLLPRTP